jgi:sterol desaturase/sphingolipid hydroxylase (fatty acid hydroxylase superfamily)
LKGLLLRKTWVYGGSLGLAALVGGMLISLQYKYASRLWQRSVAEAETHWERVLLGPSGRMILMIAVLMLIELIFLEWERTSIYRVFVQRNASSKIDLAWTIAHFAHLDVVAEAALTLGVAYGLSNAAGSIFDRFGWMRFEIPIHGSLGGIATFLVFFAFSTFSSYWVHRLQHWRYFWYLHRYHHAATELSLLTGLRSNPVEALVNVLTVPMPVIFLRVDDWTIVAVITLFQALSTLQHSELRWDFGWFGRWIMVSPRMHQIHHSVDAEHQDKNFSVFPLWDHLFGTWYAGPNLPSAYGIVDPVHVERPGSQWLRDIWFFYRDAAKWIVGLFQSRAKEVTTPAA